jgi:probable F420-dependent oxidoreductase
MKVGVGLFPTEYSMRAVPLGRALEARGFESLFVVEHTHIPASRRTPYPAGGPLPSIYWESYEPFTYLAQVAAVTERLQIGTGICLVPEHHPIALAKRVASLDSLSNGRFLFGIGAGWNAEEMRNHGTEFKTRIALMRERVLAMKELWTKSKPEFHGKFVEFAPVMTWPKPVQKPHPPIHVGGGYPRAAERAIDYGDGWMPIFGRDEILERIPEVRERVRAVGRDPAKFEISIFAAPPNDDVLARARDAGVTRCVFGLPPARAEEVLPLLDRYAALAQQVG